MFQTIVMSHDVHCLLLVLPWHCCCHFTITNNNKNLIARRCHIPALYGSTLKKCMLYISLMFVNQGTTPQPLLGGVWVICTGQIWLIIAEIWFVLDYSLWHLVTSECPFPSSIWSHLSAPFPLAFDHIWVPIHPLAFGNIWVPLPLWHLVTSGCPLPSSIWSHLSTYSPLAFGHIWVPLPLPAFGHIWVPLPLWHLVT